MKITLTDLNIILDTLLGTRGLADGGMLFKYTADSREGVAQKIIKEMSEVNIDIDVKTE